MVLRLFILFFCWCYASISFAQSMEQQTDSLLILIKKTKEDSTKAKLYIQLATLNVYNHPEKTTDFARKALNISLKNKNNKRIAISYNSLFRGHYYQGSSSDTLIKYINLLERQIKKHLSEKEQVPLYWSYGMYYGNIEKTDKEVESYLKALEIEQKYDNAPDRVGSLLYNIGAIFFRQEKYKQALEYWNQANEVNDHHIVQASVLHVDGLLHYENKEYDKALVSFQEAYKINEENQYVGGMIPMLLEEGRCYDAKKIFKRANQTFFKALKLVNEHNVGYWEPIVISHIATHYQNRKDFNSAIVYGEKALALIKQQKSYDELNNVYNLLHESYVAVKNYKKAYEIRDEQFVYADSVNSSQLMTKVEALKTEFEVEQKETENKLLKTQAIADKKTLQNRNITSLALLLGLLLIGGLAAIIYRNNRQKQKYNEALEATVATRTAELQKANKDLERANYELKTFNYIASHDIKEPIRSIGNYVGFIFRKLPSNLQSNLKEDFTTIKNSTAQLYTLIEDVSKYSQFAKDVDLEMQMVDLNIVLENVKMTLGNISEEKQALIINNGLPSLRTNSSLIYTILKNLIENGIKFNNSDQPTVTLNTTEHETYNEISIQDNGIGIDAAYHEKIFKMFKRLHNRAEYKGSGIGLAIVKLLVEKLSGTVQIESEVGKGSTFTIQFPKEG